MSITFIPVFQEVLEIVPLSFKEWSTVLAGSLLPTSIAQLSKLVRSSREDG